jgi:hypothetical protein
MGRNLGEAVAGDHGEGAAGEEAGQVDHRLAHYGVAIVLQYNFFNQCPDFFRPGSNKKQRRKKIKY